MTYRLKEKHPLQQLIILAVLVLASLIFVNIAGMLIAIPFTSSDFVFNIATQRDFSDPLVINYYKYLQIINQIAFFIIPAALFSLMMTGSVYKFVKAGNPFPFIILLLSSVLIITIIPFIEQLTQINAGMKLPVFFSDIENWMLKNEYENLQLTNAFLNSTTWKGFMINVLVMAILPALSEELFFRGLLQRIFSEWTKNPHIAIAISAFIFSFIHFQFYGFLPRFFLGILLGYMFYWSGSIWVPVTAHFLNNFIAVIVAFLFQNNLISFNYNSNALFSSPLFVIFSIILSSLIAFIITVYLRKRKKIQSKE